MATNGCSAVTFFSTCDKAFYFEVAETDVDGDAFRMSDQSLKHSYFQSMDNKFLLLNAERQFQVQNLTEQQKCQPVMLGRDLFTATMDISNDYSDQELNAHMEYCKLSIQFFKDSSQEKRMGKPVMLYVEKDGKKVVACCSEEHKICPEEMDLPSKIGETAHKAVFFMMEDSTTSMHMFESSLYKRKFLGFQPDEDSPSLKKLVLYHKGNDEVDESCQVILSDYKK